MSPQDALLGTIEILTALLFAVALACFVADWLQGRKERSVDDRWWENRGE